MNTPQPFFTNIRNFTSYKFSALRNRAWLESLCARLTGQDMKLTEFPGRSSQKDPNRKLIGVQDIPVAQITGTLGRHNGDFDGKFRPTKRHLRDRWINTYLDIEAWSPILVHKIEGRYYVEDGHHRVSVAKEIGMEYLQAKVWEYRTQPPKTDPARPAKCAEQDLSRTYATGRLQDQECA